MLLGLLFVAAFILGSIPFGFLIAKSKGIDIREVGSGNVGATNVHRALGKSAGLLVFVLDVLKGLIPSVVVLYAAKQLGHTEPQVYAFCAGLAAVLGHSFTPFLKLKGGKGVATGLGMLLGSSPLVALSAFGVFLVGMFIWRFVSLASILAGVAVPPLGLAFKEPPILIGLYGLLAVFIVYRHRSNIKRLAARTEPKFAFASKPISESSDGAPNLLIGLLMCVMISLIAVSTFLQFR